VNNRKAACVFLSRIQTAGHSRNIKMVNKFFENMKKCNYLGNTNRQKLYVLINYEQTKFEECLLLFDPETFAFPFAIE
jgi:hypothetical protein